MCLFGLHWYCKAVIVLVFECVSVSVAAASLVVAILIASRVSLGRCCLLPCIQRSATVSSGPVDR